MSETKVTYSLNTYVRRREQHVNGVVVNEILEEKVLVEAGRLTDIMEFYKTLLEVYKEH